MKFWRLSVLVLALGAGFPPQTHAQETALTAVGGEQFVVLKNGQFVRGLLSIENGDYSVQTPQGSRLIFGKEQVEFVCRSLDQAYWGKLARIRASDVEGQVALFLWCLQNRQFEHAQNQIAILLTTQIKATRLEYMNRQLEIAIQKHGASSSRSADSVEENGLSSGTGDVRKNSAVADAEIQTSKNNVALDSGADYFDQIEPIFSPLPSFSDGLASGFAQSNVDSPENQPELIYKAIRSPIDSEPSEVIQVGYTEPIRDIATGTPGDLSRINAAKPEPPTVAELDALTRSMPRGSLAIYRQQVENVFLRECAACHTSDSEKMPMFHAGLRQPITRRMSQRNLESILRFVDMADPIQSPVLAYALNAHGGAEKPSIEPDSEHQHHLVKWLIMISDRPHDAVSLSEGTPKIAETTESSRIESDVEPVKPPPAGLQPMTRQIPNGLEVPPTIGEIPELDAKPVRFVPRDEFDPEIFNRKYVDRIDE